MIEPYEKGWVDECWGRIVIAIAKGEGRQELEVILDEASNDRWERGMQDERARRACEVANKLLGNRIICSKCGNEFDRPSWVSSVFDTSKWKCEDCDPLPF